MDQKITLPNTSYNENILDNIAFRAKQKYERLIIEFERLNNPSTIDEAPLSKTIEDFQLKIIIAKREMLKTTLESKICTDKLNQFRKLEKTKSDNIEYINCHDLEKTFFN